MTDLLITNALIAPAGTPTDIAIAAGHIAAIGRDLPHNARRIINADGRAVLPGLLEPHLHLDKAFLHRRLPPEDGTLAEAIRVTGLLKAAQERDDVLARSRRVLEMALLNGVTAIRAHPDVDPIQGLVGVETALTLRAEYRGLIDIQIVAFPQEGILRSPGTLDLMTEALRLGADVVGGCPYAERTPEDSAEHIRLVFDLAERFGRPLDIHADFADDTRDPRFATCRCIAHTALARGYRGRVALGHVTSLGALAAEEARPVIADLAAAEIDIVTLPATDLYLGGRHDDGRPRRGLAPVKLLRQAGVNVTYASNNIRNAFTPFGRADPLWTGNLLGHAAQLGTPDEQADLLRMGTFGAARAMGIAQGYGLGVGDRADLVVLDTYDVADALLDLPPRLFVIKDGRVTVETVHASRVDRNGGDGRG